MALSLAQLLVVPSLDAWRQTVFSALGGLGIVVPSSPAAGGVPQGTGSIVLSGVPVGTYSSVIKVTGTGELGTALVQASIDAGATFAAAITVPASGLVVLGATGVTAIFVPGPSGSGTSFVAGDVYGAQLNYPNFAAAQQPGSIGRALAEVQAIASQDLNQLIAAIAAGGFATKATGSWADLLGLNVYNELRKGSQATLGTVTLTDVAAAGPFTISATSGMTLGSSSGLRYLVTSAGVLPKSGSLVVNVQAEQPGSAYNVGAGVINTIVAGTLAGVAVTNGPSWVGTQGTDAEPDAAYMARCIAKWPALGQAGPTALYTTLALKASASVTRVLPLADPVTPGLVDVFCAGPAGGSVASDITAVTAAITPVIPLTSALSVQAAVNVPVSITATVTYKGVSLATAQANVSSALNNYIQSLAIGTGLANTPQVVVAALEGLIITAGGIVDVSISAPAANIPLALGQVATIGTYSLTYVAGA